MEEESHQPKGTKDDRKEFLLEYVMTKIGQSMNVRQKSQVDSFTKKVLAKEENKEAVDSFLREENPAEVLYVIPSGNENADIMFIFPTNIEKFKKKGVVLMNTCNGGLKANKEFLRKNLLVLELTRNIFEHLYQTFNEIMSPIMQNPENQIGWTDLVTKDLMEKFNGYVAQVYVMMGLIKGRTMLPLPSHKLTSSDITPDKDKAHVFEGSIITWTKQIKNVLKQEPEQVLKFGNDPGPLTELEFWQNKADNLNSIHEQLQSVEVKNILRFLEGNKSTYTNPFSKLKKDVQKARIEANDNNRFLKTLKDLFEKLTDGGTDFTTLYELFIPIMHTILLIWDNSKYYNTPPRLVVLIREICNAIIAKAQGFIDGPQIFALISSKDTTSEACEKLQTTIDVCSKFKDAYFEYKANAKGGWKLTTNALFVRLDSFLERCHDILHLCNTIKQFNKLDKIELGGTKGKTLSESIQQISREFENAVESFTQVKYDIMDISQKEFDEDFYTFRSKIKELERRLASVITQGFDDNDTIYGRFKLLDNFEGLLNRPIIQDELEKKHIVLLDMYKQDLKQVQSIFLEGKVLVDKQNENAPLFLNMPPIAGALTWCKSLRDRIQEPIDKLASLGQGITEREEYKDVQKLYTSITKSIKDYEESKILSWQKEVEENSEDKLKQSLLTKDENGIVKVNFDPSLVRLLREVKYFKQLELQVPDTANEIFDKGETYRQQIVSLDMIIQNYNYITTSMHPVEEPLVKKRIQDMEVEINPGIEEHKWKSPNIDQFINKSKAIVDSLHETVTKMKESLNKIGECLQKVNTRIIDRKNKPMAPDDYDQYLKAIFSQKIGNNVKDQGNAIHKQVKEVLDAVKADKKAREWKNYNEYINCIVIDGIAEAIQTALSHLNDQIDPEYLKRNEQVGPLFDIKLELGGKGIQYDPPIEEDEHIQSTVRNIIKGWINEFFLIAGTFSRLDNSAPGDYLQEIRAYFEVKQCLAQINMNLDESEKECDNFKAKFDEYSIYWEKNPTEEFENFLENNLEKEEKQEDQEDEDAIKQNPLLQGCRAKLPPLDLFDEHITHLKTIQMKIDKIPKEQVIVWLKVDLKPLKSSLNAKIQQWIRIYTDFLLIQFRTTLKNLQQFIKKTEEGVSKNPVDEENQGDNELLMKVMKVISDVKDVEPTKNSIIKRLKEMFAKLKKHGVNVQEKGAEDPLQIIDNGNSEFSEMANKVLTKVKSDIIPMINQETIQIKKRLEEFSEKVKIFRQKFLATLPFHYDDKPSFTIDDIQANYKLIDLYYLETCKIEDEAHEYNKLERLFELQRSQYKALKECHQDLKQLKTMWDAISMINYQYNDWKSKPWRQIKADQMLEINKALQTQLKTLPKEIRFFKGYNVIVDKVKNMGTVLPLVSALHSEFMEDRHWDELKKLTAKQFEHKSMGFTFDDILGLQLYRYENNVNEIVDVAQKEAKIEKKLKKIEADWNKQIFEFGEYKETKIFLPLDNMMELLDQNSMDLMGMKSQGKYVEFFINIVENWREKLGRVDVVINQWLKVQKDWRILVNIFLASEDIRMQLPEDTKRFEEVDKEFRELMSEVQANPQVVEACTIERKELLDTWNNKIKICEKSLNDYLEQKKKAFPRFYFLSNQSLLTILSNGQNAPKVCEFLGDCFDQLQGLQFLPPKVGEQFARLGEGMISKDKEFIPFTTPFQCDGAVELWLTALEYRMREILQDTLETAKSTSEFWELEKAREDWVEGYPAQIALLTTQIVWTEDVSKSFEDLLGGSESAMKDCFTIIKTRIEALIAKVRNPNLKYLERMKIINIITIDVHGRDTVDEFVLKKIQDAESFQWLKQLKFYYDNKDQDMHTRQNLRYPWEKDKNKKKCVIKIVDWFRFYTYEYVGNAMRLVITPLTDRCYVTLTQALNLTLGGAPAGPAGTGKTETTKDLGRGVGIFVVVFNCSDQMNKDSMSQIFMGLAQAGAWGCFDEFNRILVEVLSVVATQVKCCLDALKEKQTKFNFVEEGEIHIQDTVGFFITMNPGYAGRTELPENLKALFRSCAMVVPDLVLICENMLMSEGFTQARPLSRKFVSLYMLSRELLSKQRHYDWGLRAVKSVLRQAGGLKRADPDILEDPLLMRALRDFNMPKIVTDDKPIFTRLIEDLFPAIVANTKQDPDLFKLVKETSKKDMGLVNDDNFVIKVIQLKEILEVRHCCFLIGPPGCGKTQVWKTLGKTMANLAEDWEYDTLNPKAVTSDELFGAYTKTKEWKNGVLSVIMKNQVKNEDKYKESQKCKWSVLDGDIDPEWIESLNTVMDDNKVLTLVSNDRIPLSAEMRLLFEISNLKNATPATVSRAGVLFINEIDIGWMPFTQQWLDRSIEKLFKGTKEGHGIIDSPEIDEIGKFVFYRCFQTYIEGNHEIHDKEKVRYIAPMVDMAKVQSICCILDGLLDENKAKIDALKSNEEALKQCYEAMFVFAGIWGIGGGIGGGQDDEKDMKDFSSVWKSLSKVKFPEQGTVYDYYWNFDECRWDKWQDKVSNYVEIDDGSNVLNIFSKIYVSTVHTTRLKYMIQIHLKRRKPVLFIGGAGTGKTAVIREFLSTVDTNKVASKTINFSSFTDSYALQKNIESIVEKKSGRTFGSATNKTLVCFIDDLNMPYVDKYGTQSPIQLLRQIFDYGSIFNREQLEERKFLQDLLFFSCLNQKSGSFNVDLRLQRNFTVLTMYTPQQDIIETIFGQILNCHFATLSDKIQKMTEPVVKATIALFQKILKETKFSPSASKFHYQFNFRELARIVEGLLRTTQKEYRDNVFQIQRCWVNECKRTFEDRFINEDDINLFRKYLSDAFKNIGEPDEKNNPMDEPLIFTSFVAEHLGGDPVFMESNVQTLKKVLDEKLEEYNELKARMNLVLFRQAMEHITRIARIFNMSGNNALLVGVGGSGKQSLTRLSAFIVGLEIDQMVVTSSFSMNDFKTYLQEMYKKIAKPSANPRVFMMTDQQIKDETFLIPVNDMLNSGWIFDLFPKEDTDALISNVRGEAKGFGVADNIEAITNFFLDKMRKNMKVCLCHSPVGESMRIRSRKFPGIINSTSIDWFHTWPKDALIDVAKRFIEDIEFPTNEIREAVALNMAQVHISIDIANYQYRQLERRFNYTTPKSFLELIDFYKKILSEKRDFIDKQIQRYQMGLNILAETQGKVQGLQEELKVKMVKVNQKKVETDELIEKVQREGSIAEQEQILANAEEEKTNAAAAEANEMKEEADGALQEAMPALKRAEDAIKGLNKGHITEMKNLGSPPTGVALTGRVMLILMGERITLNDPEEKVWKKAQQAMNNPAQFLQKVLDFDANNIEDTIREPCDKIIKDPSKKFNEKDMLGQNFAASKLCAWVVNILEYNRIFKLVKPLREKVQKATDEVDQKKKELAIVKERVRILTEKVNTLKKQLEEAETQKALVEADANACMSKLNAAEKLVNGLAGENKRWKQNVKDLSENIRSVIGDALLASAFVSYIAAFSARLRRQLWKDTWLPDINNLQIPITQGIEPLKVLTTEAIMAQWKNEYLPADPMSLENAAVIVSCSRWPLIIDPQLQGQIWIRGRSGEHLTIISMSGNKWLNQLIQAISMGRAVMIEGIQEEIDATLDPLLSRQIKVKGNSCSLDLGGDPVDYDMNFKLFLITKLYNPHFRPEIAAQCTIINFIVTESGLEEQLLAQVVNLEKNELEMQKQELVKQQNEFSVKLDQLESSLLESLASADPSTILDNQELINNLDNTKQTTTLIKEQSAQAKITEEEINIQRELYRPVATEGAMLYFLVISLCIMDHMYQYSLEAFTTFFFKAMNKTTEKGEERVAKLILSIRYIIYQWISRGLFERHKLTFLTLITFRLMQKKLVDVAYEPAEMDFLVKCPTKPGVQNTLDWLPTLAWDSVQGLINLEEFRQFSQNLEKDAPARFRDWYGTVNPEKEKLPLEWKKLETMPFKKLLVLRCLRPDRLTVALANFIRQVLPEGDSFLDMDSKLSFTDVLDSAINDAESANPIFFILSPGADPIKDVEKNAKKRGIERGKSLFIISLGQGQDDIARRKIEEGNREGHWVMLQNIHLMPTWLIELEKILDAFGGEAGGGNANFRLFLSADPSDGVPIGILDRSIKLTNEPPSGLRANMKRAWTFFTKEEIEDKDPKIKSILFALCFFHSTLLERRRFGPLGWNMMYPFNMGDLRDSYLVMNRYMETNMGKVPFADLVYIFGEIMYGGHIVDDWDRRLCNNYLLNIMNEFLFDELELFPYVDSQKGHSFKVPGSNPYEKYIEYIETQLQQETPIAYGLHPNAEIGFRTTQCISLFNLLIELQPKEVGDGEKADVKSPNDITMEVIKELFEDKALRDKVFNLDHVKGQLGTDNKGPYQNVFLQEIEYMNFLLFEMIKSLEDIEKGFAGILTISEKMEQIIDAISINRIPVSWQALAYPSRRGLASWLTNLFQRIEQLSLFRDDPYNISKVVMISRFFNPQSFLTAIMQVVGKAQTRELNKLYIQTEITKKSIEEIESTSKDGAYVYGFILEGARWEPSQQVLEESKAKEMFSVLPVVLCKAQQVQPEGKEEKGIYKCPSYKTEDRGNTYVFEAQLKTKLPARKWILAGVAIIMDVEGVSDEAGIKKEKKA